MSLEILIPEERLKARIEELGRRISDDYRGKTVHLVCVLKGAYTFLADLARNIDVPVTIDFRHPSGGKGTRSSGECSSRRTWISPSKARK
jgi:hypoxanthine phosphoribosyltransferase